MRILQPTRIALAFVACAALVAGACSDGGTEPETEAGQLAVRVSSASSSGAAFLITVTGDQITNPAAASAGHQVYTLASGNTLTAAIVLQNAASSGDILTFDVPDVNAAGSYNVNLQQVAGGDNALLSPSAFTLEVMN